MNNFEELICGYYRNQRQAMSNPARWPQIDIKIWQVSSGIIEAKSWYKYKGEENAYNWVRYRMTNQTETTVSTEVFSYTHNADSCPFTWEYDGNWWTGKGDCVIRDSRCVSTIRFNGYDYRSMDQGIDINTGKQLWGKPPEEGEFLFVPVDK
tara:strand:- start:563 stop:1018 length:456 start_codon:yes stop_codon:yes gene_type:complete